MVQQWAGRIRILCCAGVMLCLVLALFAGRHWPLVGDAALMHSVVYLMQHGMVLYRDIPDVNLPGTYFFEALGMKLFGSGAAGWRLYDGALLALALSACILIARRCGSRYAGLLAGGLFALIHLQDGILQVGQRDLLMAVLLLWSYVALFAAEASNLPYVFAFLYGLGIGSSATIKPVLLPLGFILLGMAAWQLRKRENSWKFGLAGLAGISLPLLASALWIYGIGASSAFLHSTRELLLLHASLGRQPMGYLLTRVVAPVGVIAAIWLVLILSEGLAMSPPRQQFYVGLLGTAFAFLAQGKGLPYQRYPFLALLLLTLTIDLDRIFSSSRWRSYLAAATMLVLALLLAPTYARNTLSFSPATPFQTALGTRLNQLQKQGSLDGKVQCLDTFGGCLGILYEQKIKQSSGFLYDCYLFTEPSPTRDHYRAAFLASYSSNPPDIFVETDQFCFQYAAGFTRIERWPEFDQILVQSYVAEPPWKSQTPQHWWHRREMPVQFRIFRRRTEAATQR